MTVDCFKLLGDKDDKVMDLFPVLRPSQQFAVYLIPDIISLITVIILYSFNVKYAVNLHFLL